MDERTRKNLDRASRSSLFIYAVSAVVIPVSLVDITSELGLNLTQAGSLSLIGSIMQFGILLGSIPIASAMGKIRPLRWSLWILALGLVLFTRIGGYRGAFTIILVIACGQAFLEALLTPLVEDIHPEDDGTRQAFLHAFWPLGVIFGTVVVGELLSRGISWRVIFIAIAGVTIAISLIFPARKRAALPRSRADFSHVGEIFSEPLFWLLGMALFFAGGAEGGITFWTASYIRIEYGTLARSGGLGTAFFALGMAVGRIYASRLASRLGLKKILLISVCLAFTGSLGIFLTHNLYLLYASMLIVGLFTAPFWPGIQTHAVRRIGADPTMVMVFLSCFGILGFSGANFVMGIIGDAAGLRMSFLITPTLLMLLLLLLVMEGKVPVRRRSERKEG